jgi:hypothetical protein
MSINAKRRKEYARNQEKFLEEQRRRLQQRRAQFSQPIKAKESK